MWSALNARRPPTSPAGPATNAADGGDEEEESEQDLADAKLAKTELDEMAHGAVDREGIKRRRSRSATWAEAGRRPSATRSTSSL